MRNQITIRKVEMAEAVLDDLLACPMDDKTRASLAAARDLVHSLRPTPAPGAHDPVAYEPWLIGCSCGFRPDARPARASMSMAPYNSHLARAGLPRDDGRQITYGYGDKIGQCYP